MAHQLAGDHFGQSNPSAIFQPQRDVARYITIGDGGLHTIMCRSFGEAGRALLGFVCLVRERQVTAGAGRWPEECQLCPAIAAKCSTRRRNRAASRAAFRQREIDDHPQRRRQHKHVALVPQAGPRHKREMAPQIFDDRRRMAFRARALANGIDQSFLLQHMASELAERLRFVVRDFSQVLLLGPIAAFAGQILAATDTETLAMPLVAEDALHCGDAAFDLILSAGTLDSVNDLPGALVQIRRALRPSGLFMGTLFGAGSLQTLKSAMLEADGDCATAHIHPQIDLQAVSGLMQRAGFADPVSDLDGFEVRYGDWRSLVTDLRLAGVGNALVGTRRYMGRQFPAHLDAAWAKRAEGDGKTTEFFNLLHLSGWAKS